MTALANIADFDDPNFDPFAADEGAFGDIADTYDRLERLRREAPVHLGDVFSLMELTPNRNLSDHKQFTVVGYKEVAEINGDPETYSNDAYQNLLGLTFGRSLTVMNPPEHARYRRIFQRAFLPGIVNHWGDTLVAPVVNALIDKFSSRGTADLVNEFAMLYPFQIIYRQLELPESDIATFHKLAVSQTLTINDLTRYGQEASAKLGAYFRKLMAERRARPGEGLIDLLLQAEVDGEKLPEDVIVSFLRQLINAAIRPIVPPGPCSWGCCLHRSSTPRCAPTARSWRTPSRRRCGGTARWSWFTGQRPARQRSAESRSPPARRSA